MSERPTPVWSRRWYLHCPRTAEQIVKAPRPPWPVVWSYHCLGQFAWRASVRQISVAEVLNPSILGHNDLPVGDLRQLLSFELVRPPISPTSRPLRTNVVHVRPPPEPEPWSIPIRRPPIVPKPAYDPRDRPLHQHQQARHPFFHPTSHRPNRLSRLPQPRSSSW